MGPVTFERGGRGLQICPNGWRHSGHSAFGCNANNAWRALSQTDTFGVRSLLREFVFGDHDCRKLRELINSICNMSALRLSNEQVIDAVAEMVATRQLQMLEKTSQGDSNARRHVMRPASANYTPSESASTPAQLRQQTSLADMPPAPAQPSAIEENFVANVNQDIQATTLKAAAVNGVPFCEVCEKARQAQVALDTRLASTA